MNLPEPFAYPKEAHARRHAPAGYKNYSDYKPWLRDDFAFRCVYCLQREMWSRERNAVFSVDHVVPRSVNPGLVCDYGNLVYACLRCNSARQDVAVLDPTREGMARHLRVEEDGTVTGLTEDGAVLVELLHLNAVSALQERRRVLRLLFRRVRYPDDEGVKADFLATFGYPEDLPDLRRPKPPGGNHLAANIHLSFTSAASGVSCPRPTDAGRPRRGRYRRLVDAEMAMGAGR
jgi:HNH endonuclease